MEIRFNSVIPVLRIFNIDKADEFYQSFSASRSIGITASSRALLFTPVQCRKDCNRGLQSCIDVGVRQAARHKVRVGAAPGWGTSPTLLPVGLARHPTPSLIIHRQSGNGTA